MSLSSRSISSESDSRRLALCVDDDDDSCVDTSTSNQLSSLRVSQVDEGRLDLQVINHDNRVDGLRQQTIVGPPNPKSTFSLKVLKAMRKHHDIPETIPVIIPSSLQRPDSVYSGWTVMYYIFIKQGAGFPLPRLVLEACEYHGLAPSQLMPNVWRILMAIQVFTERRKVHFTYDDLMIAYRLHTHKNNENRYMFVNQLVEPLIHEVGDSYKGWARHYFLVPFDKLGASAYCNIPHSWSELQRSTPTDINPTALTIEKIKWLLSFPAEQRVADSILTEDNIYSTSLRGDIPVEATMSNRLNLPLLGDKALELAFQRRKKNKAAAGTSGEGAAAIVEASSPPPPKNPRKKKRDTDADPADSSDRLILDVSPSGSAHSDFSQMSKEFKKLVLGGDRHELKKMGVNSVSRSHFRKCFETMQEAAILEEEIVEHEKKELAHKAEKKKWLTERGGFVSQIEKFSREKADLEVVLLAKDLATQQMKEEHEAAVKLFEEQLMEVRVDTEIKTMGRAAQLYEEHYPEPWDVSRYKAQLAELERLNAEMNSPADDGDAAGGSSPPADD